MSLTNQQLSDVRRYAGYPLLADVVVNDSQDMAYGWVSSGTWQTLNHRLTNLRPEEETTLINVYLTNLATLESAIVSASDNLDTAQAAVWTHNANEQRDRDRLFDSWRRRMCYFIGIAPGPSLGNGSISLTRG
ncbi:hypothetical protein ACQUFY_20830 [Robbsia andropogonis]|uniref:hypothetical protein n=1 Tax=Robbsia andropogonis TaxID=28092 RepID=UPI003D1DF225